MSAPSPLPDADAVEPALRWVRGAGITGIGCALPERVVENAQVAERLGVDAAWIERRTGIRRRRHAAPGDHLHELAARAGTAALERAGVGPEDVDLVLVATATWDRRVPNAAPQVAHSLGATRAGAIDIGAACTGFVSGLSVATAMLESGRADHVLLIGAEILSRHLDVDDRRTAGLFGDGAGAALVSAGAPGSIGPVVLESDGALSELIAADPVTDLLTMDGHETFKRAIAAFTDVVRRAVQRSGLELDDVDRFVLHQANGRILLAVGEALGVAPERMVDAIADVGNTSAASIPLALCAAQPRPGERLVLAAVGAGFTWGACVVEWGDA